MRRKNAEKQVLKELNDLDLVIRQGRGLKARQRLQILLQEPRLRRVALHSAKVQVSQLLRRTGLQHDALKILRSGGIDPDLKKLTTDEMLEYALCLAQVGAQEEALGHLNRLQKLSPAQNLRLQTYLAFVHQNRWDYAAAQVHLENVSASLKDFSNYDNLVAHVNLTSCYGMTGNIEKGHALVEELLQVTRKQGYRLLTGNLLGYQVQLFLGAGDKASAHRVASESLDKLSEMGTLDRFMVEKALLLSAPMPDAPKLHDLRIRAFAAGFFETARDCDFHLARLANQQAELFRLWIGTPFAAFRERVRACLVLPLPKAPWNVALSVSGKSSHALDPRRDCEAFVGQSLADRLIEVFTLDLYRPLRAPTIFQQLHPDEFYDPFHSPTRLHQLFRRLRQELKRRKSRVKVESTRNGWRLIQVHPQERVEIKCYRDELGAWKPFDSNSERLKRLQTFIDQHQEFDRRQVEESFGISARAANILLSQALQDRRIQRVGSGRTTSYIALNSQR